MLIQQSGKEPPRKEYISVNLSGKKMKQKKQSHPTQLQKHWTKKIRKSYPRSKTWSLRLILHPPQRGDALLHPPMLERRFEHWTCYDTKLAHRLMKSVRLISLSYYPKLRSSCPLSEPPSQEPTLWTPHLRAPPRGPPCPRVEMPCISTTIQREQQHGAAIPLSIPHCFFFFLQVIHASRAVQGP